MQTSRPMSTEFPTLADVMAQQPPLGFVGKVIECQCRDRLILEDFAAWAEHATDVWRKACAIRTIEQLDALPVGAVVRTDEGRVAVKTEEVRRRPDRSRSWWSVADEDEFDLSSDELDDLPALLLWHPDWSRK